MDILYGYDISKDLDCFGTSDIELLKLVSALDINEKIRIIEFAAVDHDSAFIVNVKDRKLRILSS